MDGILVKTPEKPVRTVDAISASASASTSGAANVGSGTASTSQQTITQTQTVGDITGSGNTINFADQTAGNTNVAASHANVNVASAWQGSQAANSGASTTQTRSVDITVTTPTG